MYRVLLLTILVHLNTVLQVKTAFLSPATVRSSLFELNKPRKYACTLPPYHDNGGYVVVDEPGARPGDTFRQATLVSYSTENGNQLGQVKVLFCSYGEWFEKKQQRRTAYLYFNASSCPFYCPESTVDPLSISSTETSEDVENNKDKKNICYLPPYSPGTMYNIETTKDRNNDGGFKAIHLRYSCVMNNLTLTGNPNIHCFDGLWNDEPPKCIEPKAVPDEEQSLALYGEIVYDCTMPRQPKDGTYAVVSRSSVQVETEQRVEVHLRYTCDANTKLMGERDIYCIGQTWSGKAPKCNRCGFAGDVTGSAVQLPWYASIYSKRYKPYRLICGGSIIARNLVLSAAHCFWSEEAAGLVVASSFAVVVGKAHLDWDDVPDGSTAESNVSDIAIPPRFRGGLTNHQDDIALLFLSTPLDYNEYVAPVCVDFDAVLDERQTKPGNVGKVVVINEDDDTSSNFEIKEMPYVDIDECITNASPEFRPYITSDKMCARVTNGTSLCTRDSGSGLAVPVVDEKNGVVMHYLRGVLVTAPTNDEPCGDNSIATFTDIAAHAHFLKFFFDLAKW